MTAFLVRMTRRAWAATCFTAAWSALPACAPPVTAPPSSLDAGSHVALDASRGELPDGARYDALGGDAGHRGSGEDASPDDAAAAAEEGGAARFDASELPVDAGELAVDASRSCPACGAGACCDAVTATCVTTTALRCATGETSVECVTCGSGTACGVSARACVSTAGAGAFGAPCVDDASCAPGTLARRPYCETRLRGGFCTDLCDAEHPCPGGICAYLDGRGLCLKTCSHAGESTDCGRPDYVCESVYVAWACVPQCESASDCAAGARCELFPNGTRRCCGLSNMACCGEPGVAACTGLNAGRDRPSMCRYGRCD